MFLPSCLLRPSSLRLFVSSLAVAIATAASPAQSISYSPTWTQQSPATSPPARSYPTMAYDAATGQVVLFGGLGATAYLADTWTWDGTAWAQQTPATSPPARDNATMAYDAATGQVVLFGGQNNAGKLGDTWTWDGTTWTRQGVVNAGPSARIYSTMAYDAATGQVVLFGGYDSGGALRDTWTWDGTTWTQQSPATSPSSRYDSTMAYDAATGQVVLFGGAGTSSYLADTWTWDGTTWTLQNPATSPPARYASTTAYDPATRQVVLFGGAGTASSSFDDTWTWDGTTWTQQNPATSPSARNASTMAYDLATAQVVLFGGINPGVVSNETWTLVLGPVNLGTANVCGGGTMPAPCSQTATVNFTVGASNVTVKNVNLLTQGAPNLDFTATATTCSGALNANTACTVTVKFAPRHPGQRLGGISLTDSSGNILGSIPLYGSGNGPQVVFAGNATSASLAGSFNSPTGVAMDGSGDVFVGDSGDTAVQEIVAVNGVVSSSSTVKTVGHGFGYPYGVAVDGSGDVFVADSAIGSVKEIVAVNGVVSSTSTVNIVGSGFNSPYGVAVDGSGDVFFSDAGGGSVKEIVAVNGVVSSSSAVNTVGSGFMGPLGVAVDGSGDVFVADTGKVKEVLAVNGVVNSSSTVIAVGSGFNNPLSVAVDASGDVFVADNGNGVVKEILAVNGSVSSSSAVITVGSPLNTPRGVAVDGSGNIFASGNVSTVVEFPLAEPPTVTFATSTLDGFTDTTDGTQTVTVQNDGNQPLIFAIPTAAGTTNPTTPNDFTFTTTGGSACPSLTTSATAPGTLAAGATCNVPLTFTPVAPSSGALTESLVFTDNNLNAASATQSLTLKGTAIPPITLSPPGPFLPNAQYNAPYSQAFTATGGSGPPYNYHPEFPLPPGLSLNASTGVLSGTPTAAAAGNTYNFGIMVTDSLGDTGEVFYSINVLPEPISTANSSLTAIPTPAVAGSPVTVTTTVLDASHYPIVGATVNFSQTITGGAASTTAAFNATRTVTNASGVASVTLTDTAAESLTLSATVSGVASGSLNTTPVTFIAPAYTVTVATDPASANESAAHCVATGLTGSNANCSLREAVDAANLLSGVTANISFATPLFSSAQTILIAQTTPITPKTSMNIKGPGANLLTIEGGRTALSTSNTQVFLQEGGTVTLSGVTVANGYNRSFGGGIYVSTGTLTVTSSTFSGNESSFIGGAIFSNALLTVTDSTFSGNQAAAGGAIGADTTLTVANSTFSGNQATDQGGAIYVLSTLAVANSTFSGNQSTNQGGAILANETLTVADSIFSGDSSSDGSGIFAEIPGNSSSVSNIVYNGDTFTGVTPANSFNASANLSPLGNYGGPTPTFLPLPASAAICAGTQPALNGTPLATDQRGVPISATRYGQTACYDIGAVQTEYAMTGPLTVPSQVTLGSPISPAPTVSLTENGTPLIAGAATVTLSDTQNDLSSGASATNSLTTGVVTFGNVQFRAAETTDQLTATLNLNSATPVSLKVTSNSFQVGQLTPVLAFTPAPASQVYGTPIAAGSLDATATYGGIPVAGSSTYTATSNTTHVATALTAGVTVLPADSYTLTATFTPTNTTLYKSGLTTTAAYTVAQATQTINFTTGPPVSAVYNVQFTVVATGGGSGIALGYASSGGCTNVGTTYTMTSGTTACTVTVSQAGNNNYSAAANLVATVNASLAPQTINFTTAPPASAVYNTQFTVVATGGGSGVALGYASAGGCTNVGATYTMTSGTTACTVTVSQTGNANYSAAANLVATVNAVLATPTLTFAAIPPHTYGDAPFTVSASSASTGAITYGVRPGPATINAATGLVTLTGAGQVTFTASQAQTSNYTSATATPVTITIARQASATSLSLSATAITPLQTVNLTAVVSPTVAGSLTPTQSVTFFDGSTTPATQLGGAVALNGGTAVLYNVSLASGAHSLYAVYSGDNNYLVSASTQSPSTIITVAPEDFTFTANGSATQSVIPGKAGTFTFALAPVYDKYPGPVTFTATGLPPGATYTVSPASVGTNAGPQTVTVTITTPQAIGRNAVGHSAPWALALLLPVFLLKRSRRRLGQAVALMLLLSAGAFALSGCGTNTNGYFGQSVQNYTVTVTGTSGTVMHSSTITLQVQ